jgi:NADH dehydrogenase [ubiquinone] 1 alpha subcomplex assembly factor 7
MTPLARLLAARIAATGPMTVADFMGEALMHPRYGYYATRDPFGAAGDFTTAPEISQMFGELLGLCLAQAWLDQGAPGRIVLAELGPGRGTLMADMLRATARVPGFHAAAQVALVEASPVLRQAQARLVPQATWHDTVADLPEGPLFLVANEFLDALPVRQFLRAGAGWRERVVGVQEDRLVFGLTAAAPLDLLRARLADTAEGDLVEVCPALPAILGEVGRRIDLSGGAALILDYGDWHSLGDTLQAVAAHAPVDPLDRPGEADLTAHVDFAAVARAVTPARHTRLTSQGVFLDRLGIGRRAEALARNLTGPALENHLAAYHRLTHPDEMGHLFKVMGVFAKGGTPPPGLDA